MPVCTFTVFSNSNCTFKKDFNEVKLSAIYIHTKTFTLIRLFIQIVKLKVSDGNYSIYNGDTLVT